MHFIQTLNKWLDQTFLKDLFVFKMNDWMIVYVLQNILLKLTCLFSDSLFFILSSLFPTNINLSNFGVQYVHTCGPQTGIKPLLCPLLSIQFSPLYHEDLHCSRSLRHRPCLRPLPRGWRGCCHVHCRHPHWWGKVHVYYCTKIFYILGSKLEAAAAQCENGPAAGRRRGKGKGKGQGTGNGKGKGKGRGNVNGYG